MWAADARPALEKFEEILMNQDTQLLMERTTEYLVGIEDECKFLFELDHVKHRFDAEGNGCGLLKLCNTWWRIIG